jgi:hypothetical protein
LKRIKVCVDMGCFYSFSRAYTRDHAPLAQSP